MSAPGAIVSKGPTRIERLVVEMMKFYASFAPFVLLGLSLMLLVHGVADVSHWLGVGNTGPPNDDEFAVLLLAGIVISLLLVIARGLERIANKVEDLLRKFDDLGR